MQAVSTSAACAGCASRRCLRNAEITSGVADPVIGRSIRVTWTMPSTNAFCEYTPHRAGGTS